MKTLRFLAIVSIGAAMLSTNALAQDATPAANDSKAALTKEERQKLKTAREAAMQDANVQALIKQQEYVKNQLRDAVRAAMIKSDPSIQPIVDKLPQDGRGFGRDGDGPGKHFKGPGKHSKGPGDFNPEAKEKFEQVREQVKNDPAVKAAHDKLAAAQTDEEKKAAKEEMHAARKAALEKIDPELAKKIEAFRHRKHHGDQQ